MNFDVEIKVVKKRIKDNPHKNEGILKRRLKLETHKVKTDFPRMS